MNRSAQGSKTAGVTAYRAATYVICAWLCIAAGGCGQKGPLYLPDTAPEVVPATATPQPMSTDPPAVTPEDKTRSSPNSRKSVGSPAPGN